MSASAAEAGAPSEMGAPRSPSARSQRSGAAETSVSAASRPTNSSASSARAAAASAGSPRDGSGKVEAGEPQRPPVGKRDFAPFVDRGRLNNPRRRAAGRRPPGRRGRAPAPRRRRSPRRRRAGRADALERNFMLEALRRCETAFSAFAPRGHRSRARDDGKARRPRATGGRRRPGSSAG